MTERPSQLAGGFHYHIHPDIFTAGIGTVWKYVVDKVGSQTLRPKRRTVLQMQLLDTLPHRKLQLPKAIVAAFAHWMVEPQPEKSSG